MRRALAKRGLFMISHYTYQHRGAVFVVAVFYRYYQRSRLQGWVTKRLRRREGALAPIVARYFVLHNLDVYAVKTAVARKLSTARVLPAVAQPKKRKWIPRAQWLSMTRQQRETYSALSSGLVSPNQAKYLTKRRVTSKSLAIHRKLGNRVRGWIDLEWKSYNNQKAYSADSFNRQLRNEASLVFGRSEVLLYNILHLIPSANHLLASRYYIFKRFSRLLFQPDLIEAVYLSAQLNLSSRLAHVIVMGLERHANQRKQRMFLKMVQATIDRLSSWDSLRMKPLIGRISIYGKLDAKMRRAHVELGKGTIRYQQLDWNASYTQQVSRTKFGTSMVHVWLRNASSWH